MSITAEQLAAASFEEVVSCYQKLEAQVKELEATIADKVKRRKEAIALITIDIQRRMNEAGSQSITFKDVGKNVHWRERKFAACADWSKLYKHLQGRLTAGAPVEDVFSAFQKKLKVEWVDAYQKDHEGHAPPGVNIHVEREIIIKNI